MYFLSYWIAFVLNFIRSIFESARKLISFLFEGRMALDIYFVSHLITSVLNFIRSIFGSACNRIASPFEGIRLWINSLKNNQNPFNENQIVLLNPATGLPMIGGDMFGFDTAGNRFCQNDLFESVSEIEINPATGLPMMSQYSGVDIAGNPYGFDLHSNNSFSSFDSGSSFDLNSGSSPLFSSSSVDPCSTGNINSLSNF